ncbi:MAG TPA: hypothetical protein VIG47_01395, partial [Gemmatimonadaceae bacterium]
FQPSGYLSLDLAAGNGEFFRLKKTDDLHALVASGGTPDLADFVERIPLEAPEGEPLKLEFESFAAALNGTAPLVVSGADGRRALAVALRIVRDIERNAPSLGA